jgi:putative membrane protein
MTEERGERILWQAEFNERVTTYWLLNGAFILTITCVGIVLVPIWFLIGGFVTRKHLRTYSCTLTNRSLKVTKGWLIRMEKTVPLDRITDLGLIQGPLMRYFDIEALSIETAGQSSPGALLALAGIKEGRKFRDAVLKQRDLVVGSEEDRQLTPAGPPPPPASADLTDMIQQIRDTLLRIEARLADRDTR